MGTWTDALKIGVPLIDLQHKQLLDQIDLLVAALRSKKDSKQIFGIMSFLDMYVGNHFGYEEQCMHINKCPAATQNKSAHAYFIARLKEIKSDLESQRSLDLTANKVTQELSQWFVNHIRGIDNQLGTCTKAKATP